MIKHSRNETKAQMKGYRVLEDGTLVNSEGKRLKARIDNRGYMRFNFREDGNYLYASVHRLQAYQKYGDEIYSNVQVRHLNGNKLDNSFNNIGIGSTSENNMDKPAHVRIKSATIASHSFSLKFSGDEVASIKRFHRMVRSYKEVMDRFNISSKGTLHYILNNR